MKIKEKTRNAGKNDFKNWPVKMGRVINDVKSRR
jgi:hypothetical protein